MADEQFHCVKCHQRKYGRFTCLVIRGSGWQQGKTHVAWYCWDCCPWGTGKRPAETDHNDMPPAARLVEARQD